MRHQRKTDRLAALFFLLSAVSLFAQDPEEWHRPFPPHRIAGNVYYVGTEDLASFLVVTPAGNILINTDYEQDVPLIRASITKLGFQFGDIRIVLLSHAHDDHVAGTAAVIQQTGARLMVMRGDLRAMEMGTTDFQPSDQHWKPVKVDRVLKDGDTVRLGGVVLTAHLTAGHTKGCTTWTTTVVDAGRRLQVV
jgi:metallo-beta-lactamase class B